MSLGRICTRNNNMYQHFFRSPHEPKFIAKKYRDDPLLFTIKLHHYGAFSTPPNRTYKDGAVTYVDCLHFSTFCIEQLDRIHSELGYDNISPRFYYFKNPNLDLDYGLHALHDEINGTVEMLMHIGGMTREIEVYVSRIEVTSTNADSTVNMNLVPTKNEPSCSRRRLFD